jgi:hypothetical protein
MLALVKAQRDLTAMGKLEPRKVECVHLCWDQRRHGYFGYMLEAQRLTTFRRQECTFYEKEFPRISWIVGDMLTERGITRLPSQDQQEADSSRYRRELEINMRERYGGNQPNVGDDDIENEVERPDAIPHPAGDGQGPPSQRTRARLAAPHMDSLTAWNEIGDGMMPICEFDPFGLLCYNVWAVTTDTPPSYAECLQTPEAAEWRDALTKHMAGKMANGTCTWVPRQPGMRLVKSKLVPACKYNPDNTIKERTIRWVGCGYSEIPGKDYNETYTATSKAASVKVFLNVTLLLKLQSRKFDVPKAFTRAELDTKLYVEQPEARLLPGVLCSKKDKNGQYYVALLHKALEGLKQAGNLFQRLNTTTLVKLGFAQFQSEPTIFVKHTSAGIIMMIIWIDDFAVGYSSATMLWEFFAQYKQIEGMDLKDEGPLKEYAGIQITWGQDDVSISQSNGIERGVLRYFPQAAGLPQTQVPATVDAKSRETSLKGCDFVKEGEDRSFLAKYPPYMSFIAVALYYVTMTRGDSLHVVVFLCRFMMDPNEACFIAAISVMACLYHTRKDCITYRRSSTNTVPGAIQRVGLGKQFARNYGIYIAPDSSWKIKSDKAMNMTYAGWVIFMFGGAIDFASRLIKVTCHSSAEAEIAAGCFAGKRGQFIRMLLNEFKKHGIGDGIDGPLVYTIDNEACDALTKNIGVSKNTEHFLRWQHYLRWLVYNKYAVVIWVSGSDETGDMMTKVLPPHVFLKHKRTFLNA